jgi:endonuclease/exonuclease/phosphatase family metal-dependent hydrolase
MIENINSSIKNWDRTFLNVSSKLCEPFCSFWNIFSFRLVAPLDPNKFENCTTKKKEITIRLMIGLGAILICFLAYSFPISFFGFFLTLGTICKLFRFLGFALQKNGYTHIQGAALEKTLDFQNPQVKLMTWNICGVGGGMSLDHGGVINWRYRLHSIIEKITYEDPDVLILQEIYDAALAEMIIKNLKSKYSHFFTHLGANIWGSVGGVMIISKYPIHNFSNISFTNNNWTLNRTFSVLELKKTNDTLPCLRIIGTHLIHGDGPKDKKHRKEQIEQIVNFLIQKKPLPVILAGDLNIERDGEEGKILSKYLKHAYSGKEQTCTNKLVAQWDNQCRSVWGETIDYISVFKNVISDKRNFVSDKNIKFENCHLVKAYDESYNTKKAISDHHGLSCTVKGF